ncbi:MAG: hypothetical protein OSB21_05060 [Myxococcota bacterium]|nr:hypothetical protein [Myxococcota bacterium]
MKTILLAVLMAAPAFAGSVMIPIQGRLTDSAGLAIDGEIAISFLLLSNDQSELFAEQQDVLVSDGLFTVYLGRDNDLASSVFKNNSNISLNVSVAGEAMGAFPLGVAAYAAAAMHAEDADTLGGRSAADFSQSGHSHASDFTVEGGLALNGTVFSIADQGVTFAKIAPCDSGQVLKYGGNGWACGADDQRAVITASGGLTRSGNIIQIASSGVTAAHLRNDSVGHTEIASGAVRADEIANDAVGHGEIANNAVRSAEIANDAVGHTEIASGAVRAAELANDAVDSTKIADNAVRTAHIRDGDVVASKIATNSITQAHLAAASVAASKVAVNAVALSKIDSAACVQNSLIHRGANGWECSAESTSRSQNGTTRLSSGIILKWGMQNSTWDTAQTFSYPERFPSFTLMVQITRKQSGVREVLVPNAWTRDGFTVDRHDDFTGTKPFSYFAIGY